MNSSIRVWAGATCGRLTTEAGASKRLYKQADMAAVECQGHKPFANVLPRRTWSLSGGALPAGAAPAIDSASLASTGAAAAAAKVGRQKEQPGGVASG